VNKKNKIMLVDDDVMSLESLERALMRQGYLCDTFSDPTEALSQYDKDIHQLLITDFRMPKLNGIEVITSILQMDNEAKIIIYSAYADEGIQAKALDRGALLFLKKPFNYEFLIEAIQRTIAQTPHIKRAIL
jgi:DNA-binding NtrC family response regulator